MIILGIDTATPQVGCAIGGHEGVLASFQAAKGMRHAETLAPAIKFLTERTGIELSEIGAVAVDVGPGLFTGMRVGLSTAKALAQALRVPMIGISSLDLLAFPHRRSDRVVVPVVDARKGEVFYAMYRQVPGGVQRVSDHQIGSPDDLASELLMARDEVLLVGDGALRYHEAFDGLKRVELADGGFAHPSASSLVQLAHAQALREQFVAPWELEPLYLRKPDAEINWPTRAGVR